VFSSSANYWVVYPVKAIEVNLLPAKHYGIVDCEGAQEFVMPYSDSSNVVTQINDCFFITIASQTSTPEIRFTIPRDPNLDPITETLLTTIKAFGKKKFHIGLRY